MTMINVFFTEPKTCLNYIFLIVNTKDEEAAKREAGVDEKLVSFFTRPNAMSLWTRQETYDNKEETGTYVEVNLREKTCQCCH